VICPSGRFVESAQQFGLVRLARLYFFRLMPIDALGYQPVEGISIKLFHVRLMFVVELRGDLMFWVRPVIMLIGGAAVWRIGSVLNARAVSERYAQS
jgi:hypothetical protein